MDDTTEPVTDIAPDAPARRLRLIPLLLVALALIGVGVGVGVALLGDDGDGHPSRWDPRIAELASFVERERGLRFEHPVFVEFLDTGTFRRELTEHEELTDEDRAQLENYEAMLRALGLVHGDIDLEEVGDDLLGEGVVGFYRFEDERIVVRGETLDDERRATLVHELTHALQDQHFDIGDREPESSGAQSAFEAVVEADAEAVQAAWVATLSAADREALAAAEEETAGGANFEDVPEVFVDLLGYPYVLGPLFLDLVVEERGARARDELLREPPTTEEHILRPATYLDDDEVAGVDTPALADGETLVEDSEDDFGMLSLLVVLAERVDFVTAWDAVQGWAGDASVAFERDGVTCVRVEIAFDSAADADRFGAAFRQWAGDTDASVSVEGDRSTFESCDPGSDAQPPADERISGVQGVFLRAGLVEGLRFSGAPLAAAECVADEVVAHFGADRLGQLDELLSAGPDEAATAELQRVAAAAAEGACANAAPG